MVRCESGIDVHFPRSRVWLVFVGRSLLLAEMLGLELEGGDEAIAIPGRFRLADRALSGAVGSPSFHKINRKEPIS